MAIESDRHACFVGGRYPQVVSTNCPCIPTSSGLFASIHVQHIRLLSNGVAKSRFIERHGGGFSVSFPRPYIQG